MFEKWGEESKETCEGKKVRKRGIDENCAYLQYPFPVFYCAYEGSVGVLVVTTELIWEGDQPEDVPLVRAGREGLGLGGHQTWPRVSPAWTGLTALAAITRHTGVGLWLGTEDVITGDDDLMMMTGLAMTVTCLYWSIKYHARLSSHLSPFLPSTALILHQR